MRFPQLVAQVHADHSRVVLVLVREILAALEKFILGVLVAPPEAIAVVVGAAPLRGAGVVVEDYHEPHLSQGLDCNVEDFHGGLADQLRVRLQVLFRNDFVVVKELEGVGETDAVHFEFVPDVQSYVPDGAALQPINALSAQVTPGPVAPSEFDSPAEGVDYFNIAC